MKEEERDKILQEARLRFPVGTEYVYVGGVVKGISKITGDLQWGDYGNIYGVNWRPNSFSNDCNVNDCNVYVKGEWAKVIRRPVNKKVLTQVKQKVKELINQI